MAASSSTPKKQKQTTGQAVPDLDLRLSLGEGSSRSSFIENNGAQLKSHEQLLTILTSSLTEEERAEKKMSRQLRTRKRSVARNRIPVQVNSFRAEALAAAAAMSGNAAALEDVAVDLATRAIASASQSAALFGALVKIQSVQKRAAAITMKKRQARPVLAPPVRRMNPTGFHPLLRDIQSEPIQLGAKAKGKSPMIDPLMMATPTKNQINFHSFLEQTKSDPIIPNAVTSVKPPVNPVKPTLEISPPAKKAITFDLMTKMPSVKAEGDGPNGKKVEGFLSQWLNGQVIMVCQCHGSHMTPVEFVEHAGCTDVSDPMKHITVSFSPKALI